MLASERLEEFEVEVANLFLCDGAERVNWIEPSIEGWGISELLEACLLEQSGVFDAINGTHKGSALRGNILVGLTEIFDVVAEVSLELSTVSGLRFVS